MAAPVAHLAGDNGEVRGMRCVRTQMRATDASGRRRPEPIPGSEFELAANTVLPATGQFPDGSIVGESGKGMVSADG